MKTVKVGKIEIGSGLPKIIVPLVGQTRDKIIEEAQLVAQLDCDLVEWRLDFYQDVCNFPQTLALVKEIKNIIAKPLLATFRTQAEGGEMALPTEDYFALYHTLIHDAQINLLDVELFLPAEPVAEIVAAAQANGIKIVMCNHDFNATPAKDEIISRLRKMQDKHADICKIAVMPQSAADVLVLLSATEEMKRKFSDRPLITMSMGALGMVSRVSGQVFGSDATFGAAKTASAPGQVPVAELRSILKTLRVE